jgi:hypothetical protein
VDILQGSPYAEPCPAVADPGCSHVTRKSILYLNSEILRLPKRMPVPEVATYKPMCARPYARVGRLGHYHDILASVEWLREQKWSLLLPIPSKLRKNQSRIVID